VFYMSLVGLEAICRTLIDHGRAPQTPVALVEKGTTQQQRVLVSNLKDMPAAVASGDVHGPTLLIVGEVVNLNRHLNWFQPKN